MILEHAPHFDGIWESAVKSMKTHLRQIVSTVKFTFEEFTTVPSSNRIVSKQQAFNSSTL